MSIAAALLFIPERIYGKRRWRRKRRREATHIFPRSSHHVDKSLLFFPWEEVEERDGGREGGGAA